MRIENRTMYADEGKYLTNGEVYAPRVDLGAHDYFSNWTEVDEIPGEGSQEDLQAALADALAALALLDIYPEEVTDDE